MMQADSQTLAESPEHAFARVWGEGLRELAHYLDKINATFDELSGVITENSSERERRVQLAKSLNWPWLYSLPPRIGPQILLAMVAPAVIVELLGARFPMFRPIPSFAREFPGSSRLGAIALKAFGSPAVALVRTISGLAVHQQTLNQLVDRVRKNDADGDEAFFDAVGLDPAAIFSWPLQRRLRLAVLEADATFLGRLGSVLKDPPKPEQLRDTARLNTAFFLMSRFGALDHIRDAEMAYEIFVKRARLYKGIDVNVSAKENLWKLVRKAQRRFGKIVREGKTS